MSVASPAPSTPWNAVLDYVRAHITPQQFETWFKGITCRSIGRDGVVVATPNAFYRRWMETHYQDLLERACSEVLGAQVKVDLTVDEALAEGTRGRSATREGAAEPAPGSPPPSGSASAPSASPAPAATPAPSSRATGDAGAIPLNPLYTFTNFVVGPSNRLAHAACLAVTENPAHVYNPLFLHGDVGLGKTHLLQAVCAELLHKRGDLRFSYISCETFLNEYISALQKGQLESFRQRYRHIDLLLIDDVHFLANKKAFQEEFFHTFNALYNAQKQIVLSSDAPPNEIPDLEARITSRFGWGLVAEIEAPHYETKSAIIRRKAMQRGRELADDVVDFLANALDSNIRELEGAVLKVIVMAGLQNRAVDVALCRSALKELTAKPSQVGIGEIMAHIANHFNLKISDLQGKKRSKSIVLPRQICMYLGRKLTGLSLEELGGHFGGRDHTTVLYSEGRIRDLIERDAETRALIERFLRELQRGH